MEQELKKIVADKNPEWNKNDVPALQKCIEACTQGYSHHGLTYEQQRLIYEYYRNDSYSKDSEQNNYYNMLLRAGFRKLTPYDKSGRLLVLGGKRRFDTPYGYYWAGYIQACDWLQIDIEQHFDQWELTGEMFFRDFLFTNFNKAGANEKLLYRKGMKWQRNTSDMRVPPDYLTNHGSKSLVYDVQILSRTNESFEYLEF